jgi:hypothetical protein
MNLMKLRLSHTVVDAHKRYNRYADADVPGVVPRRSSKMSAIAPRPYAASTASVTSPVPAPRYLPVEDDAITPNFPQGIDYDRWAAVVRPSPREAFADRLDLDDDLIDD